MSGNGVVTDESTKRELQSTKRELQSTKRELQTTKRELQSTKRIKDTAIEYGEFGAPGLYRVAMDGKEHEDIMAIYITVLGNGELNLITDEGRWFLFAPDYWKSVKPLPPVPGECEFCGHRPYEPKPAQ